MAEENVNTPEVKEETKVDAPVAPAEASTSKLEGGTDTSALENEIKGLRKQIGEKDKQINSLIKNSEEAKEQHAAFAATLKDKGIDVESIESLENIGKLKEEIQIRDLRFEVAKEKGLPLDVIDRLKGGNKEEMMADADELSKFINPGLKFTKEPNKVEAKPATLDGSSFAQLSKK